MLKLFIILFVLYLLFGRNRERRGPGFGLFSLLTLGAGYILVRILIGVFILSVLAGILFFLRAFVMIF